MYVLRCIGNGSNDGKYVSKPSMASAYTLNIKHVRTFATIEEANNSKCGNEVVVAMSDITLD